MIEERDRERVRIIEVFFIENDIWEFAGTKGTVRNRGVYSTYIERGIRIIEVMNMTSL